MPRQLRRLLVLLLTAPLAQATPSLRPAEDRIDMVPGRTLVVPVLLDTPDRAPRVAKDLSLRLDDTRQVPAELWALTPGPPILDPTGWLAPIPTLLVHAPDAAPANAEWIVLAAVPPDAAGQGLWLDQDRWPLNWLPDPFRLAPPAEAWGPAAPATPPPVDAAAALLAQSPITRWRALLLTSTLAPVGPFESAVATTDFPAPATTNTDLNPDTQRVLRRIAEHTEARWQVALAWLALESPDTAAHIRARLAGTIRLDTARDPITLPCFDESSLVLTDLLPDLLSPFVDAPTRVLRAQAFLDAQPERTTWVIDDAGRPGSTADSATATLGVAALGPTPVLAKAVLNTAQAAAAEVVPIAPRTAAALTAQTDAPRGLDQPAERLRRVTVQLADSTAALTVAPPPIPVRPPGAALGPFVRGWSMASWVSSTAPSPPAVPTRATLRRTSGTPGVAASAAAGANAAATWSVLVECTLPTGTSATAGEAVTLFAGPFGVPSAAVRVTPDGRAMDPRSEQPVAGVRTARTPTGWAAEIPLPPAAIDARSVCRLGLVRAHASGGVSSWPRPVTPGQPEPGRAALDLAWWDGLDPTVDDEGDSASE